MPRYRHLQYKYDIRMLTHCTFIVKSSKQYWAQNGVSTAAINAECGYFVCIFGGYQCTMKGFFFLSRHRPPLNSTMGFSRNRSKKQVESVSLQLCEVDRKHEGA
jgi:hypothetical protein